MASLAEMMARFPRAGRVSWIGLRPGRREPIAPVTDVDVAMDGLVGDRGKKGKRAVTLIQVEHGRAISSLVGREVHPHELRRNIAVEGINLLALRDREVEIGTAWLLITGIAAPCSRMEEVLGEGGYNAMRGHGGVTAEVLKPGRIAVGDAVVKGTL